MYSKSSLGPQPAVGVRLSMVPYCIVFLGLYPVTELLSFSKRSCRPYTASSLSRRSSLLCLSSSSAKASCSSRRALSSACVLGWQQQQQHRRSHPGQGVQHQELKIVRPDQRTSESSDSAGTILVRSLGQVLVCEHSTKTPSQKVQQMAAKRSMKSDDES